jgi:hypothetical protein
MVWQDVIITICIIAFSYALIPQIILGFKKKKKLIAFQTALITSIGMFILSITYITLGLPFSAIMGLITAMLWAILLIQGIIYKS